MRNFLTAGLLLSTALATSLATTTAASADESKAFDAVLAGHTVLPAETLIPAPADASESLKVSGKYTGKAPMRVSAEPTDGAALPFNGQPVQGFSGIKTMGDDTYFVGTDNGFGKKVNSPDAMLMYHTIKLDFETGEIEMVKTTFISDLDKVIPFVIINEGSESRYLTGVDINIEGFQPIGQDLYRRLIRPPMSSPSMRKAARSPTSSRPRSTARRCVRPTITPFSSPILTVGARTTTSSAPRALRVSPPPWTAPSSMACWKARCGTRPKAPMSL